MLRPFHTTGEGIGLLQYIARRTLLTVPILLGTVVVVFFMVRMLPGNAAMALVGQAKVSAATLAEITRQLGLNEPWPEQLWQYVFGLLHGSFGLSYIGFTPVATLIGQEIGATLRLTAFGMTLAILVGVPLGVTAAVHRNKLADVISMSIAMLGISIPPFFLSLVLIELLAVHFQIFPATGDGGIYYLVLPGIALGVSQAAIIARLTRAGMVEILDMDYVRTAHAKGLSHRIVVYRHALANALLPVLTMIGMQVGSLMGGAVVIEEVFARQGIGSLIVNAILHRDTPTVQGGILVVSAIFILVNLLVDISYALIDPRIRYQ